MSDSPKVLVGIASYGTAQDHYLARVIAEYRRLPMPTRIVVFSNQEKVVEGAEVVVGLPSANPYSLPFAPRTFFAAHADDFDLFIYSEDDVLITENQIHAFLRAQERLNDDEIAGFIRSETSPEGERYITSIHQHFRWIPETTVDRGGELFAQLTNDHSGCFMVTRAQLRTAIDSGGFLVAPHAGVYGMLECAASDIYVRCGLRRLICVSQISDFVVPHLPNKYFHRLGIPIEELHCQVETLARLHRRRGWAGSLFDVQTRAPGFRWSKDLYAKPDPELLGLIPGSARTLLSVGAGSGDAEEQLAREGMDVTAIAADPVSAGSLRRRGIRTVEGPLGEASAQLARERFDVVLLDGVLHLVPEPVAWLETFGALLQPGGVIVARVSHTTELGAWIRDVRRSHKRPLLPDYRTTGVQAVGLRRLRRWCTASGLELRRVQLVGGGPTRTRLQKMAIGPLKSMLATEFLVTAARRIAPVRVAGVEPLRSASGRA